MGCVDEFLDGVVIDNFAWVSEKFLALFAREVGVGCH